MNALMGWFKTNGIAVVAQAEAGQKLYLQVENGAGSIVDTLLSAEQLRQDAAEAIETIRRRFAALRPVNLTP